MKKAVIMLLVVALLAGVFGLPPVRAAEGVTVQMTVGSTKAYVNSVEKILDQPPVIENSRTLVPFRFIGEALGAAISWNAATRTVGYVLESKNIVLTIGSTTAYVNGVPTMLDVAPKILPSGRTVVPVRFISESLGAIVDWNPTTRVVTVTYTPPATPVVFKRSETLYMSGAGWGPPSDWNPLITWSKANSSGTIGLIYETLFLYDPLTDVFTPWLAESPKDSWLDKDTYQVKLRKGVTWSDGKPLTADDVKFTFELGKKYAGVYYSTLWNWLKDVEKVDDYTLKFHFIGAPYQSWDNTLFNLVILPKYIWESKTETEVTSGVNDNPIGSGAYKLESYGVDRIVYVRNDNWWATKLLGLKPAPKRLVQINFSNNNVALGALLKGDLDLSNNFLPGVAELVDKGYIQTYYPAAPYNLSANTATLVLNNTKKPMDDPAFRKAVAYAIDVDSIINIAYANLVKASDSVGLLPTFEKYVDKDVVKKLGFSYDTAKAKKILADAGYKDKDGDGFVEAKDGSKIALKVTCPTGWTDWMMAIEVISKSCKAAGINLQDEAPDYGAWNTALSGGTFDMTLNNWAAMTNTVWATYDTYFHHPITDIMGSGNWARYDNPKIFALVDQLVLTPTTDLAAMKAICSQIQEIQLTDMPLIPLWYNGLWAQISNLSVWTNWPSSAEGAPHYTPCSWSGYWQMGGLMMLCELKLK